LFSDICFPPDKREEQFVRHPTCEKRESGGEDQAGQIKEHVINVNLYKRLPPSTGLAGLPVRFAFSGRQKYNRFVSEILSGLQAHFIFFDGELL